VVRCESGDAACVSPVRELSHAPPMRLRSRDPIGCSRAVVSAMGTSRFDARARPRSARVDFSLFPARSVQPVWAGRWSREERKRRISPTRLSRIGPSDYLLFVLWYSQSWWCWQLVESRFACGLYFYFTCKCANMCSLIFLVKWEKTFGKRLKNS